MALKRSLERLRRSDTLEAEIRAGLERNGFSSAIVERVVAYLLERRLVNDKRTIENLIATRTGKRAAGTDKLRFDLQRRGAPEDLIESYTAQISTEAQRDGMHAVLQARLKRTDPRAKGARLLLSRGFSAEEIESVLDEFFGPEEV